MAEHKSTPDFEYRTDKAIIRIHGKPDYERIEKATIDFMRKVERSKQKQDS